MRFRDLDSPGASAALDRHITGNYGEDAYPEDEPERCFGFGHGCSCPGCEARADAEVDRIRED